MLISGGRVRRVAVRPPNWIGDVVHALPALEALRAHFPKARITALAHEATADILVGHPAIDEVIRYPPKSMRSRERRRVLRELRTREIEVAIAMASGFESAWLLRRARIPVRAGYALNGRGWLLSHPVPCTRALRSAHMVDYYLGLLSAVGISERNRHSRPLSAGTLGCGAREALASVRHTAGGPLVALCPGAAFGPAKRWPIERFAELAAALVCEQTAGVVVLGSGAERALAGCIADHAGTDVVDLAGRTSLGEAIAVLRECDLAIGNDSGLLHLASACGTPSILIFGPGNPRRTGPRDAHASILHRPVDCSPCNWRDCPIDHRCLRAISVDDVHARALATLGASRGLDAASGSRV